MNLTANPTYTIAKMVPPPFVIYFTVMDKQSKSQQLLKFFSNNPDVSRQLRTHFEQWLAELLPNNRLVVPRRCMDGESAEALCAFLQ